MSEILAVKKSIPKTLEVPPVRMLNWIHFVSEKEQSDVGWMPFELEIGPKGGEYKGI